MSTFLRSGLWCAELNSIINFHEDVEGSRPFGVFVSCWHRSKGDPAPGAGEIFGGSGNGFVLRHSRRSCIRSPNGLMRMGFLYASIRSGIQAIKKSLQMLPSR